MTDPKDIAVASARLEEDLTLYALSDGNTPARRALFDQAAVRLLLSAEAGARARLAETDSNWTLALDRAEAAEASLAQAREQLAEAVKVISSLVAHHDALAEGPKAHHLG